MDRSKFLRPTLSAGTKVLAEGAISTNLGPHSLDPLVTKIILSQGAKGVVVGQAMNQTKVVVEFLAAQADGTEIRVQCPVEVRQLKALPLEEPEEKQDE